MLTFVLLVTLANSLGLLLLVFLLRSKLRRALSVRDGRLLHTWMEARGDVRVRDARFGVRQGRRKAVFRSQHGEDTILYDALGGMDAGFFVEAGAADGLTFSNSYFLECLGWRGLLVEANPTTALQCKTNRPGSLVVQAALGPRSANGSVVLHIGGHQGMLSTVGSEHPMPRNSSPSVRVPYRPLDSILEGITDRVHFLSLDVEGHELDALDGISLEKWQPVVLLVEANNHAARDAIIRYLQPRGYVLVRQHEMNSFFCSAAAKDVAADLAEHW